MDNPKMYNVIADTNELKWFFDHVIQKPQVNESYSAVFVSRHKKLTKEEQEEYGLTRREAEFLATQTFRLKTIKDVSKIDELNIWTFDRFLQRLKRFNVDTGAYTTSTGAPIPEKTLAVIFYVNPCDDVKVCKNFVDEYLKLNEAIVKAMLSAKGMDTNYQSYQWFGNAENTLKHLKANCKGSRYWLDFDIDVPKWFKEGNVAGKKKALEGFNQWPTMKDIMEGTTETRDAYENICQQYDGVYFNQLKGLLNGTFSMGNYVIIDTSGGYHVLVRTSVIRSNPHDFCKQVKSIYDLAINRDGNEPYLDENGNLKFECVVNDSQIPGLPLPGTYQYGRPVTVLNKEDFE